MCGTKRCVQGAERAAYAGFCPPGPNPYAAANASRLLWVRRFVRNNYGSAHDPSELETTQTIQLPTKCRSWRKIIYKIPQIGTSKYQPVGMPNDNVRDKTGRH